MSEEPRITIEKKEKDPKKVAGGRKLAAISKAAKNSKRDRGDSEEASSRTKSREDKSQDYAGSNTNFNYFSSFANACGIPIIAAIGVAVGIGYYLYLSKSTTPPAPSVPSQKTNLIYL